MYFDNKNVQSFHPEFYNILKGVVEGRSDFSRLVGQHNGYFQICICRQWDRTVWLDKLNMGGVKGEVCGCFWRLRLFVKKVSF